MRIIRREGGGMDGRIDGQADRTGPLAGDVWPLAAPGDLGDDFDLDAHIDWLVGEIDAGRQQVPPERDVEGPALSLSLGDASDLDPALLAAMCGPDGPGAGAVSGQVADSGAAGGRAAGRAYRQYEPADVLRPGPVLAALTAQAVDRPGRLTDDELIGSLQAARRLANLADYQQTVVIAEFARRRQAQFEAAQSRGKPVGCRDGEFPGEELAIELTETLAYAGTRIDTATELATRLPRTLAGMADGLIDLGKAMTIALHTRSLADADAACADEVLAAAAPGKRLDQLARKAAALEMRLAPEAVRARKELARQRGQRVEARREESGNASLAGRELDTADVIASKAHIDAIALRLRDSGLLDGSLDHLRALALTDLTQGRDPLDRIGMPQATDPGDARATGAHARPDTPPAPVQTVPSPGPRHHPLAAATEPGDERRWGGPGRPSGPAPLPALVNLLVPAATLLGWGTAPGQAAGWGVLDADETRSLVAAAARHPRTRWCVTVTAPDGTAVAHGCASGRHPWAQPGPAPPSSRSRHLSDLLRSLNLTLEPVARDTCDHRHAESRYVPSRKLRHLIRARSQTCTAPGCNAQAVFCDLDHTVPYPAGPTDQCNVNPKCRRHHRVKQAPGWHATQPEPDTSAWTTPSGRVHATAPTVYDL